MNKFATSVNRIAGLTAAGIAAAVAWRMFRNRNRISFRDRVVVITGGSRGLGFAMARKFAKEGARLVLLARNGRELRAAKSELRKFGAEVVVASCDVRNRRQVERTVSEIIGRFGQIDVLINNAGMIQVGPIEHMTYGDFREAMDTHFYGALNFMLAVVPHMRARRSGRIVNISSVGGIVAAPHLAPYSASKFALTGLSDGFRAELRNQGVFVTTVCPGLMRTGSPPNARFKGRHQAEYAWFTIADSAPLLSVQVDRAAEKIIESCRLGQPHLTVGFPAKMARVMNGVFPGIEAHAATLAHRLLPDPAWHETTASFSGWESESKWAPSVFTRLTYRAATKNNERAAAG